MAAVAANAQTVATGERFPVVLVIGASLLIIVVAGFAFFAGRRRGRAASSRKPGRNFSGKNELLDELDTENMELTQQVRQLSAELEQVRQGARSADELLEQRASTIKELEEVARRDRQVLVDQVRQVEADLSQLRTDLAEQECRNDTLQARLSESEASAAVRPWPPGHEELDASLALEDSGDAAAAARLNNKLALARNTIAEFLHAQRELDEADARAAEGQELLDPAHLDDSALRTELKSTRRQLARVRSEMQMQGDVIRALEGDAVELKRAEKQLEDKSATETFLNTELTESLEEIARLRALLNAVVDTDEPEESRNEERLLKAVGRSGDDR